jgi:transcriptional regulator with XRE-family HTH domain
VRRFPQTDRAVAEEILEHREQLGLSARELSKRLGRAHNYISRFESLERLPTAGELIQICKALGLEPSTLMKRVERRLNNGR